jgi:predicted component of type VI protein secretion system
MDIQLHYLKSPKNAAIPPDHKVLFNNPNSILIGRESGCDIVLSCEEKIISRKHASINKEGRGFTLTDTSANGTYLNQYSQPIGIGKSIDINNNDIIRLGEYSLKVSIKNLSKSKKPFAWEQTDQETAEQKNITEKTATPPLDSTKRQQDKKVTTQHKADEQQANNKKTRQIKKEVLSFGNVNESFSPPAAIIPQDWNLSLSKSESSAQRDIPKPLQKSIDFTHEEQVLLEHLLKGLGISSNDKHGTLTPKKMMAVGRCLRAAINGMIKNRDYVEKMKSKLCFDEKGNSEESHYSSFANFNSTEEFLTALLEQRENYSEFPLEIMKCQKEIIEDQSVIYKSFSKSIDDFRDELSPFTIEQFYQKNSSSIKGKLVPSVAKWELYRRQWSKKCISFKKIIKQNFENNIKPIHQNRIAARQLTKKNV